MSESQQNQAYKLLIEKYVQNPSTEELEMCGLLFSEWCQSGNQNVLSHLLEIIGNHESQKIRSQALESLKKYLPVEFRKNIIELWINHPTPTINSYIRSIVKTTKLSKPLIAATYLMLNEWDLLEQIDPEFEYIDQYIKELDPLMGSLLFARINQLKSFENYEMSNDEATSFGDEVETKISLLDKIRSKDYEYLWDNILQYPFPFICELLQIFHQNGWVPHSQSDLGIFQTLVEQIGTEGWDGVKGVKWMVLSIKVGSKFQPLTDIQTRNRQFELLISPELINRPDRIKNKDVKLRGHYNLVNPDIDLHIYHESIRKSDIDGLLHIPIYSSNGVELAEFMIPAINVKSFTMDEDGLYFTIRNPSGLYSVDIDALATIVLPVTSHSEAVTEIIPSLKEKARKSTLSVLNSLELLSSLHRGREFSLWDLKEKGSLVSQEEALQNCTCTIGIDIGDYNSKAVYYPDDKCNKEFSEWEVPSLIHFLSLNEFIIGHDVKDAKLENSSQTFKNWKSGLYLGNSKYLRIRHTKITAKRAYELFAIRLLETIINEINHGVPNLSAVYSLEIPLSFQRRFMYIIQPLGFEKVTLIDNLTALILSEYKLANIRGTVLAIDVGSSQMSAIISTTDMKKSRKRLETGRMREKQIGRPQIIAKLSVPQGSSAITSLLQEVDPLENESYDYDNLKEQLSFKFEASKMSRGKKNTVYSINDNPGSDVINFKDYFMASELFAAFKLLIRNIIVKGTQRGVDKSKIDTIIISGHGSNWPLFLDYLHENYQNMGLVHETNGKYALNGAITAMLGQNWVFRADRDYMLKITDEGTTHYETLIARGEEMINQFKNFEVRIKARFEHVVLDCWTRIPKFINDPAILPLNDSDATDYRRSDFNQFVFDRIHREISPVSEDSILQVIVNRNGKLSLNFKNEKSDNLVDFQTFIH